MPQIVILQGASLQQTQRSLRSQLAARDLQATMIVTATAVPVVHGLGLAPLLSLLAGIAMLASALLTFICIHPARLHTRLQ